MIENLMTQVLTMENLRPIADALATSLAERNDDVSERIVAVQGRLDEVQKAIRQLVDTVEKMGFSTHLQTRLQAREQKERELISEMVNLEDLIVKPKDMQKIGDQQIREWIESIRTALSGDDIGLAQRAIRQFVGKIVVNEQQKTGTLYYTFPLSDLSRNGALTLTGVGTAPLPSLNAAIQRVLARLYWGISLPETPVTDKQVSLDEHNCLICARFAAGETLQTIAQALGISHQRVHQIVQRWC